MSHAITARCEEAGFSSHGAQLLRMELSARSPSCVVENEIASRVGMKWAG